jgi:hypothetical protein
LDKFVKINPSASTNPSNELAIVRVEEEEPTIGISEEEEENIEINADDNNVSGLDNPTNSSAENVHPPSVDEPSFYSDDIYDPRN